MVDQLFTSSKASPPFSSARRPKADSLTWVVASLTTCVAGASLLLNSSLNVGGPFVLVALALEVALEVELESADAEDWLFVDHSRTLLFIS